MEISNIEAKKNLNNKKYVFLDVRTLEERRIKKIDGSLHIDIFEEDFEDKIKLLDKSKKYIVYCRSGGRSASACIILDKNGFKAINLVGGMLNWN
jgi:rhodanese-related sulfurtransferase